MMEEGDRDISSQGEREKELPVVREKGNQFWITLYREYNKDMLQLCATAVHGCYQHS